MEDIDTIRQLFKESQPFFTALGDPVRQELLLSMMDTNVLSVKELTARTNLSRPTVSHHLKILKDAQIIEEHRSGRQTFYRPQIHSYFYTIKELIDAIDTVIDQKEHYS